MPESGRTTRLRSAIGFFQGLPLYFMQERLLFPRQPLDDETLRRIAHEHPHAEEIRIETDGAHSLHGWLVRPATPGRVPLLIYFAGNADEVSNHIPRQSQLGRHALLLMNYRGYGRSAGTPSEPALLADALRIFDAVAARPDIDPQRISALGRSLGSAVAIHLASRRPVSRVVLVTPFDSIASVAQSRYPDVPIRLFLRHPFDSMSRVASLRQPVMFLVAGMDDVVPLPHAHRLFDACPSTKLWRQLEGSTHGDIVDHPQFWGSVSTFLNDA